ncbi:5-dehydro-2-deoxygluconokinase, partial [Staphylococcus cohnii]|uniref:PfkB family carbohydrate kinase n=2 Tax=Staphylococcus TaxID=1279 RepID=UPI000D44FBF5
SYAAAFLYALVKGKTIDEALKYGAASAAIVVSSHSSSEAMPTSEKLENFIGEHDKEKI